MWHLDLGILSKGQSKLYFITIITYSPTIFQNVFRSNFLHSKNLSRIQNELQIFKFFLNWALDSFKPQILHRFKRFRQNEAERMSGMNLFDFQSTTFQSTFLVLRRNSQNQWWKLLWYFNALLLHIFHIIWER